MGRMNQLEAAGSTTDRIRDAAVALFYERGYHGTTMRELAAAAGIRPGAIYNHYASKQELLVTVAGGSMLALMTGARERVDAAEGPEARLRALVGWHVRFHAERRLEAIVQDTQLNALEPENRERVVAIRDAYEQLFRELLDEGNAAGVWKVESTKLTGKAIAAMCTGVGIWYREDGPLSPDQIADDYAGFILAGCKGKAAEDAR